MPNNIAYLEMLKNEYRQTIAIERKSANVDAFVKSQIVAELRKKNSLISEIEKYNIPWVTALICNSAGSLICGKEQKYKNIRPLYCHGSKQVIVNALNLEFETFRQTVIPLVDEYIIENILNYESELLALLEKRKMEIKNCKSIINQTRSELKKEQEVEKNIQSELSELTKIKHSPQEKAENMNDEKETPELADVKNDDFDSVLHSEALEDTNNSEKKKDDTIENIKKKLSAVECTIISLEEKIKEQNQQKENLEKTLAADEREIERLHPYIEGVNEVKEAFDQIMHARLDACYEAIRKGPLKDETEIVEMLLQGEKLEEIRKKIAANSNVINKIFTLMEKERYYRSGIDIIASMLGGDILDITDDRLRQFLSNNTNLLRQYLIDNLKSDMSDINADPPYHKLFNVALEQETATDEILYSDFWDEIESSSIWGYIVEYLDDEEVLAKIVTNIRGRVMKSFMDTIETHSINMPSFVQALSKQKDANSDMIFRIVQNYDKKLSKANRDLRRANARMDIQEGSGAAKVFSAMYRPMEKLEMLTYDIKMYDGFIKKKIISSQMMECVSSFRKGLTELEVFPMEDFDVWKLQREVDYDSAKHRYEDGKVKHSKKVKVKTLGYSYSTTDINGDAEEHFEYSKVIPAKG